jgi:hypothetical protein
MTEKQPEQLDNPELETKLQEWLQSAPLYSEYRYMGGNATSLPKDITLFCEQCRRETTFRTPSAQVTVDRVALQQRQYRCTNCKENIIHFCYSWYEESKTLMGGKNVPVYMFRKHGQWPPIEERVKEELQKALGDIDLKFYKVALRLRNFGNGIAAMTYMRRVVENHMSEMIDILRQESEKPFLMSGVAETEDANKSAHVTETLKQEIPSRFFDKVDYAAKLFPASLVPQGYPNPLKPLYALASDAIHNLPEDEAVTHFDKCRYVFEHVFSSLRPALNERKAFLDGLRDVAQLTAQKTAKANSD